jgi:hypothetical protein
MRLEMIRLQLAAYQEAKRILAASFTSVAERKAAIDIRDEFKAMAPALVQELLDGINDLIDATDGEECADPETCGFERTQWMCSRCKLREIRQQALTNSTVALAR